MKRKIRLPMALALALTYLMFSPGEGLALPSFPGAQGYGTQTPGGRGGQVLIVDDLSDDPANPKPGTFRWALTRVRGPRTVVFAKSGYITLEAQLELKEPFLTIAGESAPGDGVTVRGSNIEIKTSDVIIRYLRFRLGSTTGDMGHCDPGQEKGRCTYDTMTLVDAERIVFDHCSFSWSIDEVLSMVSSKEVTVQYSIISDPLLEPLAANGDHLHSENASHGFCSLIRGSTNIALHHNIYANCSERAPQFSPKGALRTSAFVSNNFIYHLIDKLTKWNASTPQSAQAKEAFITLENNLYEGPADPKDIPYPVEIEGDPRLKLHLYLRGNLGPYRTGQEQDQFSLVELKNAEMAEVRADNPLPNPGIRIDETEEVRELLLAQAGANFPRRDSVDESLVELIRAQKLRRPKNELDMGGFPELQEVAGAVDSDKDGMADAWEREVGLNVGKHDANEDRNGDAYTNLEEYLQARLGTVTNDSGELEFSLSAPEMDASEDSEGKVGINEKRLDIAGDANAFLFNVRIPRGREIKRAYLIFTAATDSNTKAKVTFQAFTPGDVVGFGRKDHDLTARGLGLLNAKRTLTEKWKKGKEYRSKEFGPLLEEWRKNGGTTVFGILLSGAKGGKGRPIYSRDSGSEKSPRLVVELQD